MTPRSLSRVGLALTLGFGTLLLTLLIWLRARPFDGVESVWIVVAWVGYVVPALYVVRRFSLRGSVGSGFVVFSVVAACFAFFVGDAFERASAEWQIDASEVALQRVIERISPGGERREPLGAKLASSRPWSPPMHLGDVTFGEPIEFFDYCRNSVQASIDVRRPSDVTPTGPHFEVGVGWCWGTRACESARAHVRRQSLCTTISRNGSLGLAEPPKSPITLFRLEPEVLARFVDEDEDREISRHELSVLVGFVTSEDRTLRLVELSVDSDGDGRILEPELVAWLRDAVWPGRSAAERAVLPRPRPPVRRIAPAPEPLPVKRNNAPAAKRPPQKVAPL